MMSSSTETPFTMLYYSNYNFCTLRSLLPTLTVKSFWEHFSKHYAFCVHFICIKVTWLELGILHKLHLCKRSHGLSCSNGKSDVLRDASQRSPNIQYLLNRIIHLIYSSNTLELYNNIEASKDNYGQYEV